MKRFLYFAGIVSVLLGGQACTNEVLIEHEKWDNDPGNS